MKKNGTKLLLVEDDSNLGIIIQDFLAMNKYDVVLARDGNEGYETFKNGNFDLCILDVMLPLKDGFQLAQEIRNTNSEIPIIFLTARIMEADRIKGFRAGADDYITKPFSTEELNLRIEAILKRSKYSILKNNNVFHIGSYTFNYTNQSLSIAGEEKRLTRKESDVLRLLCLNKNEIVKREVALKNIWGDDDYFMGRSMDVYITKLRKFLKNDKNVSIVNIPRTGFKLIVNE